MGFPGKRSGQTFLATDDELLKSISEKEFLYNKPAINVLPKFEDRENCDLPRIQITLNTNDGKRIQRHYLYLKETIEALDVVQSLFYDKVLNEKEIRSIQSKPTKAERNQELLSKILQSGPDNSYTCFLNSLNDKYPEVKRRLTSSKIRGHLNNDFRNNLSTLLEYEKSKDIPSSWKKGDMLKEQKNIFILIDSEKPNEKMFVVKEKQLPKNKRIYDDNLLRHNNEYQILKDIDHESFLKYFGSENRNDTLFSFFSYIPMGSLADNYKKHGPVSESKCKIYTEQILEGLDYLHRKFIAHLNIQGTHILLETEDKISISGFSYWHRGSQPINCAKYGNKRWTAPEAFNPRWNNGLVGCEADIWSLGCTLVEMLTADVPYEYIKSIPSVIITIGNGKPPVARAYVSDEMKEILKRCFKVKAIYRPTASQLLETLRQYCHCQHTTVFDQPLKEGDTLKKRKDLIK